MNATPSNQIATPLKGYVCSTFGPKAGQRLELVETKGCAPASGRRRRRVIGSDIISISGHHYARIGMPLDFDAIPLDEMRFVAPRVRLLMISSCAALRHNAIQGFRRKFPNAYVFGWLGSAPDDQNKLMQRFLQSITHAVDLESDDSMSKLIGKWRKFIESERTRAEGVRPYGLGYATPKGEVTFFIRRRGEWKWITRESAH